MFSEELKLLIIRGIEKTDLEYKSSMDWKDRKTKLEIIRAMLALSNNSGGGAIVIGVKEDKKTRKFIPTGMKEDDFNSYKYDDVARVVKNYSNPLIAFKITADEMEIENKMLKFVVIQVRESRELPVICIKTEKCNKSKPAFPKNICLRANTVYVRSKAPIESREIASMEEWREFIDRILEKSKKELIKKMPCSEFVKAIKRVSAPKKFDKELKKDKLL